MKTAIFCLALFFFIVFTSTGQEKSLKEKALIEFQNEHYSEAILLLEKALKESPADPEIYYYLGWFNHYRAYDSRPLKGYDYNYSKKIFAYLDTAIKLKPDYGDAKYFYGAECSANAFNAMQNFDLKQLRYFYSLAFQKGAYPPWLIEFGKNMLNSCGQDAILFTGGNADFDICSYLQLCEHFRTDITIIPITNIDRPWYMQFLKKGLEDGVRKVNLNLTDKQIMDMHPYKWDSTTVSIAVSDRDKKKYKLSDSFRFDWKVAPDFFSDRMHSNLAGEKAKKRSYLSPQRAVLVQIIEDNFALRPICFSNMADPTFYGGLDQYFQNCGLVSRLLPFPTVNSDYLLDTEKLEKLFREENFMQFPTIKTNDLPRISRVITVYHVSLVYLAAVYRQQKEMQKLENLRIFYKNSLKIGFDTEFEQLIQLELDK